MSTHVTDREHQQGPVDGSESEGQPRGGKERRFSRLGYVVIHRVDCSMHDGHQTTYWNDVPRLVTGDTRANPIHGIIPSSMQDNYGADFAYRNPDLSFIVTKRYDCGQYHDSQDSCGAFHNIEIPEAWARALAPFRSFLSVLEKDGPEAKVESETITFISGHLQRAIHETKNKYPQFFPSPDISKSLNAPYLEIYHARSILETDILRPLGALPDLAREHLATLVNYVLESQKQDYQEADAEFASGYVSHHHFFKLVAPDDILVDTTNDEPVAYKVKDFPTYEQQVVFRGWKWGFDGRFYKEEEERVVAWPAHQSRVPIKSLPLYPLKFAQPELRARMYARGEIFWSCRKGRLVECDIPSIGLESRVPNNRFMVDLNAYRQMHRNAIQKRDSIEEGLEDAKEPPDTDFYLLLPAIVRGFGFHDKKWVSLSVEKIREVTWENDVFEDRLVMQAHKKKMIEALVTEHTSNSKPRKADIVSGKGDGLILLLHGGPGTGKTLTAESIAERVKRPLYRVTCGDIGTDPESVEKYLEAILHIGSLWRCVVLMDEGDVFLEERRATDLQRNALVSVFLRTLEYLDGIMILTSNRVGTFDEAFKSRIHLSIYYPPLDEDDRRAIWVSLLEDLLEGDLEQKKLERLKKKANTLAQRNMNGRLIRNVINNAWHHARFNKRDLEYSDIEIALEISTEFEKYLVDTRGHTDEQYAQEMRIRS